MMIKIICAVAGFFLLLVAFESGVSIWLKKYVTNDKEEQSRTFLGVPVWLKKYFSNENEKWSGVFNQLKEKLAKRKAS
ncbi:hypothetical protein D0469_20645 [Peribacillus saganii]|uniref:Uncharacterized protein n=1 Tax=Peribacillus saganii TaxID=2303992 RepID=A0A372L9P3_9BACI|nr:hypothetical protein [Peribacillus saganii]RFU62314.1 hypothetical protein D0469_20645 [Peribacillus saganii]